MWICPKCGRAFKKTNQSHYCGEAPKTVPDYIAAQAPEAQPQLAALRAILQSSVPDAREYIAWSMPYYEKGGRTLSFSACKKHSSLYVGAEVLERFGPKLEGFVVKKSALYLPYEKELPTALIAALAKDCLG